MTPEIINKSFEEISMSIPGNKEKYVLLVYFDDGKSKVSKLSYFSNIILDII